MDVLTSETCWTLNKEIIKQVTSSWSPFIQLSELLYFSFGWFSAVEIHCADVSEHTVSYIFIGVGTTHKISTPGNHSQKTLLHSEHGESLKSGIILVQRGFVGPKRGAVSPVGWKLRIEEFRDKHSWRNSIGVTKWKVTSWVAHVARMTDTWST